MQNRPTSNGLTILELVVILAIIAVLAAIATPNFLESQTRSRSARLAADLRSGALNYERYDPIEESAFKSVQNNPLSTFSVDVDTASYSNVRRFLDYGQLPPADAVRIEEMINYFPYSYAEPKADSPHPLAVSAEVTECPWAPRHRIARIGIQARTVQDEVRPDANLVFLIDVSGSMGDSDKLPLLRNSFPLLVEELRPQDRVAIVVYAGNEGLILDSTPVAEKDDILKVLSRLESGGSTNGGAGLDLAYKIAKENYIDGGINRVILATDGDFNVGITDTGSLVRTLKQKAADHIYLSVLGFGQGNLNDAMMEQVSNWGNGNYFYIDSMNESRKVFSEQGMANMMAVARDVKIQVEFNPTKVQAYRLLGYENRALADEDFNDDTKDAGDVGSGHQVTALYEIVPPGVKLPETISGIDPLKYQQTSATETGSNELMTVKIRYKLPEGDTSTAFAHPVADQVTALAQSDTDTRFALAVAGFGMLLRDSNRAGNFRIDDVISMIQATAGMDPHRIEFGEMVKTARDLNRSGV